MENQVESKTNQFEIVLVHALVHNLKKKKVLNFYLQYNLKKFGHKSRNSLEQKII